MMKFNDFLKEQLEDNEIKAEYDDLEPGCNNTGDD